jgi:hypothetical protein
MCGLAAQAVVLLAAKAHHILVVLNVQDWVRGKRMEMH